MSGSGGRNEREMRKINAVSEMESPRQPSRRNREHKDVRYQRVCSAECAARPLPSRALTRTGGWSGSNALFGHVACWDGAQVTTSSDFILYFGENLSFIHFALLVRVS